MKLKAPSLCIYFLSPFYTVPSTVFLDVFVFLGAGELSTFLGAQPRYDTL